MKISEEFDPSIVNAKHSGALVASTALGRGGMVGFNDARISNYLSTAKSTQKHFDRIFVGSTYCKRLSNRWPSRHIGVLDPGLDNLLKYLE